MLFCITRTSKLPLSPEPNSELTALSLSSRGNAQRYLFRFCIAGLEGEGRAVPGRRGSRNLLQKDSEYLPCQITHTCKRHCFSYSWKRFSSWTVPSCTAGNVLIFTVLTNLRYYFPPFIVMFSKQPISATCLIFRAQKWGEARKENQLHPWSGFRQEMHGRSAVTSGFWWWFPVPVGWPGSLETSRAVHRVSRAFLPQSCLLWISWGLPFSWVWAPLSLAVCLQCWFIYNYWNHVDFITLVSCGNL